MALPCRPVVIIHRNQTIKMIIFVYLCALLSLAVSYIPSENGLRRYIELNSQIRAVISNMSSYMYGVDHEAMQMGEHFHQNVTTLAQDYGEETAKHFRNKYEAISIQLAKNGNVSDDCQPLVQSLLRDNDKHQGQLSIYIAIAVDNWGVGFRNLYYAFTTARSALATIEKEAYDCFSLFKGNDPEAPANCETVVLRKLIEKELELISSIDDQSTSLIGIRNAALTGLYGEVNDRFIPSFYDETEADNWLRMYCSE